MIQLHRLQLWSIGSSSLVPRPSHRPVFDRLQYAPPSHPTLSLSAFALCFWILQAIKNWTVERPGNEAKALLHYAQKLTYYTVLSNATKCSLLGHWSLSVMLSKNQIVYIITIIITFFFVVLKHEWHFNIVFKSIAVDGRLKIHFLAIFSSSHFLVSLHMIWV